LGHVFVLAHGACASFLFSYSSLTGQTFFVLVFVLNGQSEEGKSERKGQSSFLFLFPSHWVLSTMSSTSDGEKERRLT